MGFVFRARRLVELTFGHDSPQEANRALRTVDPQPVRDRGPFVAELVTRLERFAAGDHRDGFLDVQLDLDCTTEFQRRIIHCCRRLKAGKVATYGELAAKAGYPRAARAVGQVMATNRFPLVVPCHRVVAAHGLVGGFSAPQGLAMKKRLLMDEGIDSDRLRGAFRDDAQPARPTGRVVSDRTRRARSH